MSQDIFNIPNTFNIPNDKFEQFKRLYSYLLDKYTLNDMGDLCITLQGLIQIEADAYKWNESLRNPGNDSDEALNVLDKLSQTYVSMSTLQSHFLHAMPMLLSTAEDYKAKLFEIRRRDARNIRRRNVNNNN